VIRNPIILKELVQLAHHRRTYAIRAGLPALAMVFLGPQVWSLLERYGQDWRAIAMITRPLFETSAWLQFIAFSALAFGASTSVIHQEWTNRTIEVLCATPLSRVKILYGKFAAVLIQVVMMALALLPITAVLYYLGRLPREMALGSFAVSIGSVLFFGSIALLQASAFRPRQGRSPGAITIILPFLLVLVLLDAYVFVRHPALEALIPPRALYLVLYGIPPRGWSTGQFAVLSTGLMSAVSGLALLLAPLAFSATFARSMRGERRTGVRAMLHRWARGRRPKMKPRHDPFVWQEKGAATRLPRWTLWVVYGVTGMIFLGGGLYYNDFGFLDDDIFYATLVIEGLIVVTLSAGLYGATVFAREKSKRTAHALLLTGHPPWRFFWAKVRATYWALRYSFAAVVIFGLVWTYKWVHSDYGGYSDANEMAATVLGGLEILLLGPAIAVVVGMVFSSAARTVQQAMFSALLAGLLAIAFGFVLGTVWDIVASGYWHPGQWLLPLVIVTAAFLAANRTWGPFRLSVLLALCLLVFFSAGVALEEMDYFSGYYPGSALFWWVVCMDVVVGVLAAVWLVLGLRIFDAGLAGELPVARGRWRR